MLVAAVGALQARAVGLVEAQAVSVDDVGLLAGGIIVAVVCRAKRGESDGLAVALGNDSALQISAVNGNASLVQLLHSFLVWVAVGIAGFTGDDGIFRIDCRQEIVAAGAAAAMVAHL